MSISMSKLRNSCQQTNMFKLSFHAYFQCPHLFFYRASLDNVFFPSVTLCNINQGRRSFFVSKGLSHDSPLMSTVLSQAYFGSKFNLTSTRMAQIQELFSSQEVVTKGLLGNLLPTKIANLLSLHTNFFFDVMDPIKIIYFP